MLIPRVNGDWRIMVIAVMILNHCEEWIETEQLRLVIL